MSMGVSQEGEEDTPMSDINVTPLVDVMLVLLIIFLIAVPVVLQTGASGPPTSARSPDVSVFSLVSPIGPSPPSGFDEPFLQATPETTSASSAATPNLPTSQPRHPCQRRRDFMFS